MDSEALDAAGQEYMADIEAMAAAAGVDHTEAAAIIARLANDATDKARLLIGYDDWRQLDDLVTTTRLKISFSLAKMKVVRDRLAMAGRSRNLDEMDQIMSDLRKAL